MLHCSSFNLHCYSIWCLSFYLERFTTANLPQLPLFSTHTHIHKWEKLWKHCLGILPLTTAFGSLNVPFRLLASYPLCLGACLDLLIFSKHKQIIYWITKHVFTDSDFDFTINPVTGGIFLQTYSQSIMLTARVLEVIFWFHQLNARVALILVIHL